MTIFETDIQGLKEILEE